MTRRQAIRFAASGGVAGFLVRTLGKPKRMHPYDLNDIVGHIGGASLSFQVIEFAYDRQINQWVVA